VFVKDSVLPIGNDWDCGTPHECVATEEDFDRIMEIHYEFVREGGKIQYSQTV